MNNFFLFHGKEIHILCEQTRDTSGIGIVNEQRWILYSCNRTNKMHLFLKFIFGIKLYVFRTVPLSIVRSFFTIHTANLYDTYHCCVYSEKTPDDGQRNCPKHVEFYSKNKFEK